MELLITTMILQVPMTGCIIAAFGGAGNRICYSIPDHSGNLSKGKGNRIITEAEQEAEMIKQRKCSRQREIFATEGRS